MLNHLVELSLRYKVLVLIIFAVIAFLGLRAVRDPVDAPDNTLGRHPLNFNVEGPTPGAVFESAIVGDPLRLGRESLDEHRTFDAVRTGDASEQNASRSVFVTV